MPAIQIRLVEPQPASSPVADTKHAKIVIGGAGRGGTGNQALQDRGNTPVVSGPVGTTPVDLVSNGFVITRVPYVIPDQESLVAAPFRVKEELARFIQAGIIEVLVVGGAAFTPTTMRQL